MDRSETTKRMAERMGLRPAGRAVGTMTFTKEVANYTIDRNGTLTQVQFERTR